MRIFHWSGSPPSRRPSTIGEHKPSIPARTMAALACIAQNDSQQLLDEIVQQEGLEYATEVVIARQFIARCYESDPLVVTLQYQDEDYGYGYRSETYNEFDLRLRKHLSLAEESCWQRCADKLKVRRPFIALILPEKPEIANELVGLECPRTHFHSKWLKVVANDPTAVKTRTLLEPRIYLAIEKPATCRMKTTSATRPAPRTRTGSHSAPRDVCP
ncbi:hypothetical protein BANRA_00014 [Escherichia coli]|nr:hypothetical protein BANRA_00014 [Escherichia coli]